MDISVIIATWNRAHLLSQSLTALSRQTGLSGIRWEVILVDHNCVDGTAGVAEAIRDRTGLPLRIVQEHHPALSAARNTGIRTSSGRYLAFTDDDVLPEDEWVRGLYDVFEKTGCDAVGGKVLPVYPAGTPAWIKTHQRFLNGAIVFRDEGDESRFYDAEMLPFVGANMAVSRACLERVGGFSEDLGPGTDSPVGGEDTDLFRRIAAEGRVYYSTRSVVRHLHQPDRMRFGYVANWFFRHGYSIARCHQDSLRACERRIAGVPAYLVKEWVQRGGRFILKSLNGRERLPAWCKLMWMSGYCSGARKTAEPREERTHAWAGKSE